MATTVMPMSRCGNCDNTICKNILCKDTPFWLVSEGKLCHLENIPLYMYHVTHLSVVPRASC